MYILMLAIVGPSGVIKRLANVLGVSLSAVSLDNVIIEDNQPGV